jgi:hypothetical protein
MEGEIYDHDTARYSAPNERDTARHPFTIAQAVELFAELSVPRSKRSIQRFCEQGHLDCVRIKGVRGDQFFINRESIERYAEELRQIEAVATISIEPRHDTATQRAAARYSAPPDQSGAPMPHADPPAEKIAAPESDTTIRQLTDELLNLRIDNRGKEQFISFLTAQAREKDQHLQDLSYRLGAAETRVAQLEAPKTDDDAPRQSAPEPANDRVEAIIMPAPASVEEAPATAQPEPPEVAPQRSFFGRLFG